MNVLKRVQESQQRSTLLGIEGQYLSLRGLGFAAMPQHGFQQIAGAAVVEELGVAADAFCQANAPQRWGAPFPAIGLELAAVVGQPFANVVEQQIAVGPYHLVGQFRFSGVGPGGELRRMALLATRLEEQVLARQYLRSIDITSRRHPEVAAVKQDQ